MAINHTEHTKGRASGSHIKRYKNFIRNAGTPQPVDYDADPYSKHTPPESEIGHSVPFDDEDYIGVIDGRPEAEEVEKTFVWIEQDTP